jgi:hypothetical protein
MGARLVRAAGAFAGNPGAKPDFSGARADFSSAPSDYFGARVSGTQGGLEATSRVAFNCGHFRRPGAGPKKGTGASKIRRPAPFSFNGHFDTSTNIDGNANRVE